MVSFIYYKFMGNQYFFINSPGSNQNGISALYNAMIHPFHPMVITGAIWYQGQSAIIIPLQLPPTCNIDDSQFVAYLNN